MRLRFTTILVLGLAIAMLCGGCVRRRMTVSSNPPGATVYLDGKEIGRTPFSTNFDYYGNREFRCVKDGYETKTVILPVRAPWYQWVGIDLFSEVLLPGKLTDRKYYEFDMQPMLMVPPHELVGRAEELRQHAHINGALKTTNTPIINDPNRQSGSITPQLPPSQGATIYQQPIQAPQPQLTQPPTLPTSPSEYMPPNYSAPMQPAPNYYLPPQ